MDFGSQLFIMFFYRPFFASTLPGYTYSFGALV